jgi:iron complex transport system permease protein
MSATVARADVSSPVRRSHGLTAALALAAAALALVSLTVGAAGIPLADLWRAAVGETTGPATPILLEIRLPRTLLGLAVGASLGLSGAALQGLLRNPLAEPGIIGASAAAALGAAVVFYFGLAAVFPLALPLAGMAGALGAVALLYAVAGRDASVYGLILAGVAISALAGALTMLALSLAPSPYAALEIAFWLMGSLADRGYADLAFAAPLMALGWAVLLTTGRGLDALTLGEEVAQSLGVGLGSLRTRVVVGTALAVGAAVSVSGAIGFVGLVVPHVLRRYVGHEPGRLLVPSALGGACLLLAADIVLRALSPAAELKIGVATALIGAPFFFYLVLAARRSAP